MGIGSTLNGLTSITLPNSIKKIGDGYRSDGTFGFCSTLNAVYVDDLESWLTIEFDQVESNPLSKAQSLYVNGELLTNLVIPTNVNEIKNYTFNNCDSIVTISMGGNIKTIGHSAFENCDSLVSVVVPYGVTNIGSSVFSNCQNLVYAKISDSVVNMGSDVFNNCTRLATTKISKNLTTIPYKTFYNCTNLKEIGLNNSVKSICESAFEGCTNLNEVLFGSNIEYIGKNAFGNCAEELFSISNNARYLDDGNILYDFVNEVTDFICASKLIAEDAMAYLTLIENVTLTKNVKFINLNKDMISSDAKIKYNEYSNGYYLGTSDNPYYAYIMPIEIPTGEVEIALHADTKIIADNAFDDEGSYYDNTICITIPEGVTHIGRRALAGLGISELKLPSTIQYISSNQWYTYTLSADLVMESTDIEYIDKIVEAMGLVETVYLQTYIDTTDSAYLTQNFTKQSTSDKLGYDMYVKNS